MAQSELRIVDLEGSDWAVRAAKGLRPRYLPAQKDDALAVAVSQLQALSDGGHLEIYGEDGELMSRTAVGFSPQAASPPAYSPPVGAAAGSGSGTWPLKFVWPAAAAVTLVFGYMLTPWQALVELAESQGVSEDVQSLMWRAGGYTLPAVAATIASFFILRYTSWTGTGKVLALAAAFAGAALICRMGQLGLPVDLSNGSQVSAAPYIAIPYFVGTAYLNAWGWPLFLTAIALGTAAAMHLDNLWVQRGGNS